MWFIIDDQMADDRRIRRLPLATVGLWVKLCVIHSKGVSMQAKDPAAYPGHFDKLDLKDAGGTMKQLQQLVDSGLMEEHDGGWRPVYAEGICREPRVLTEEQREARRKAGSKGGRRKAANQKAKQTSGDLLANSQANGEQNSSETGSETSSNLLEDSQAKTWHKTDTDADIPSPTPPAGKPKQTATPDAFAAIAEAYPGSAGAKGRKTDLEARGLVSAIAENPAQLARLQSAVRRYRRAVNDGQVPRRQIPRLNTWLRDQWETWAPEPFALGFSYRCYSAVFPVFPTVPAWFAYHSNSLQITAITGKAWAKCGHGIRGTCAVARRLRPRRFPPACR